MVVNLFEYVLECFFWNFDNFASIFIVPHLRCGVVRF